MRFDRFVLPDLFRKHLRPRLFRRILPGRFTRVTRYLYAAFLLCLFLFTALTVFTAYTISFTSSEPQVTVAPFPVSVDPTNKVISEDPGLHSFIANEGRARWQLPSLVPSSKLARFIAKITRSSWYQMAIPGGRLLVIFPGERKEEVAKAFGDILGWSSAEKQAFMNRVMQAVPELTDGQFYPERYLVAVDADPDTVADMVVERFQTEVVARYQNGASDALPMQEALVIASLLEREAYDFENMREISGVIWNRLFIDMPLQLDATLQYAKGSQSWSSSWWPVPTPQDKYIDSPYNTYQNDGLPPGPIANPSLNAVVAALNPVDTDCLFYFHDSNANFYCSETYEEHVANLRKIYGRGR